MNWPSPSDYAEVLQSPRLCFSDPALRLGQVTQDKLGLPRAVTGNFACVFRVQSGARVWATRGFLRNVPDAQKRYAAISKHLARVRMPYTVDFEYQPEGIRIKGAWLPLVKMEWVAGQPLDAYVAANLRDSGRLRALAEKWVVLVNAMRQAEIAHGDLQHGNILVINHELKLIDYDGMFVPDLAGLESNELGHRNYQHPLRDEQTFDVDMDRFSAWTIYLSLLALSVRPDLWRELRGGDEALLLRREDFVAPGRSQGWQALARVPDGQLAALLSVYRQMAAMPVAQLPPLDVLRSAATRAVVTPGVPRTGGLPGWIDPGALAPPRVPPLAGPGTPGGAPRVNGASVSTPAPVGADWMRDHVVPAASVPAAANAPAASVPAVAGAAAANAPAASVPAAASTPAVSLPAAVPLNLLFERLMTLAYFLVLGGVNIFGAWQAPLEPLAVPAALALDVLATGLWLGGMAQRFYGYDVVKMRRTLEGHLHERQGRLMELDHQVDALDESVRGLERAEQTEEARARKQLEEIDKRYQAQRANVQRDEQSELARALDTMQHQHLEQALKSARIEGAPLIGIGPKLTLRLREENIRTAADVVPGRLGDITRIPGMGWKRAGVLYAWRELVASGARNSVPARLPQDFEQSVRAKWQTKLQKLKQDEVVEFTKVTEGLVARRQQAAQQRATLDQDLQAARREHMDSGLELARVQNDLSQYPPLVFPVYLAQIFGLERMAAGWMARRMAQAATRAASPRWQWPQWPRLGLRWPRVNVPPRVRRGVGCALLALVVAVATCGGCGWAVTYLASQSGLMVVTSTPSATVARGTPTEVPVTATPVPSVTPSVTPVPSVTPSVTPTRAPLLPGH